MIINIIHLTNDPHYSHREEREKSVIEQMEMEQCEYKFWPGIMDRYSPKVGISKAHKQIISYAKERGLKTCCIAEDDLKWTAPGSWKYFQDHIPAEFDIFVSSYYSGRHDENFVVHGFGGLTLYVCHERYFDTFLSLNENIHIDTAISLSGAKVIVSPLFTAIQNDGYSEQRKRICKDGHRLKGKQLYGT